MKERLSFLAALCLIAVSVATATNLAISSRFNTPPDEVSHADAFCYYESHWRPPNLNSDAVLYGPYGMNRVYYREAVYTIYGQLARLLRPLDHWLVQSRQQRASASTERRWQVHLPLIHFAPRCAPAVYAYRLLNVLLYAGLLIGLLFLGRKRRMAWSVGAVLLCLPGIVYIFSAANSDAWAIAVGVMLVLAVLVPKGEEEAIWLTWRRALLLGALTGLLLVAKRTMWVIAPYAYALLAWQLWEDYRRRGVVGKRFVVVLLKKGALLASVAVALIAPLRILYPWTQGNWQTQFDAMREARALHVFKPSIASAPMLELADKGIAYREIATDLNWWRVTLQSYYGVFGHLSVYLPGWIYRAAASLLLLCLLLTLWTLLTRWRLLPAIARVAILLAPPLIILNVMASLYYSWVTDYQPQGRFLYATLVPLALLTGGTVMQDKSWVRWVRVGCWLLLYAMCLYMLWTVGLVDRRLV